MDQIRGVIDDGLTGGGALTRDAGLHLEVSLPDAPVSLVGRFHATASHRVPDPFPLMRRLINNTRGESARKGAKLSVNVHPDHNQGWTATSETVRYTGPSRGCPWSGIGIKEPSCINASSRCYTKQCYQRWEAACLRVRRSTGSGVGSCREIGVSLQTLGLFLYSMDDGRSFCCRQGRSKIPTIDNSMLTTSSTRRVSSAAGKVSFHIANRAVFALLHHLDRFPMLGLLKPMVH